MRPRADVHEDDGTCDETLAQRETRVNGDRPDFSGREYLLVEDLEAILRDVTACVIPTPSEAECASRCWS